MVIQPIYYNCRDFILIVLVYNFILIVLVYNFRNLISLYSIWVFGTVRIVDITFLKRPIIMHYNGTINREYLFAIHFNLMTSLQTFRQI